MSAEYSAAMWVMDLKESKRLEDRKFFDLF